MLPDALTAKAGPTGRINVALAEELGLVDRSMILCYEAIEFEPTPPARFCSSTPSAAISRTTPPAPRAYGVMGNAQQPIMALPDIYLFARGSWDPKYLDRSDEEVLRDLAGFLGGHADLLVPAWQCLVLPLDACRKTFPPGSRGPADQ